MSLQGLLYYGRKRTTVCIVILKIFPMTWDSDTSRKVSVTSSGNVLSCEYQSSSVVSETQNLKVHRHDLCVEQN